MDRCKLVHVMVESMVYTLLLTSGKYHTYLQQSCQMIYHLTRLQFRKVARVGCTFDLSFILFIYGPFAITSLSIEISLFWFYHNI